MAAVTAAPATRGRPGAGASSGRAVPIARGRGWQRGRQPEAPLVPSSRLTGSPIVRGVHASVPAREALILLTVLNHPWLLDQHGEELAAMEFRHSDADRLRRVMLDAAAGQAMRRSSPGCCARRSPASGSMPCSTGWSAPSPTRRTGRRMPAAEGDVIQWWNHVLALHRRQGALHRELKAAERALGDAPSDENLARLKDLQERLTTLDGAEAEIEDFGVLSGRQVRSL